MTLLEAFDPVSSYSIITAGLIHVMAGSEAVNDVSEDASLDRLSADEDNVDALFFNEFEDVMGVEIDMEMVCDVPVSVVLTEAHGEASSEVSSLSLSIPGLRSVPDQMLADAGRGEEKLPSDQNDRWALKRADSLRAALNWDTSIFLGDLPLHMLDLLLSNLFSRAVKVDGNTYPSSTLMNMMNAFNRIIRRASDLRSVRGQGNLIEKGFNINSHPVFAKTRMVLKAAVKKSAREGVNKKRKKAEIITEEMEIAVLSDIDHQITSPQGCQKRLAFFFLVRLGIRGGSELYNLMRNDVRLCSDKLGREYVHFEERESKNNSYSLDRYNEEQFRKSFYSYEIDFIICLKQYLRHLPPLEGDTKPDLFLGPITNPVSNVWYNRKHKVAQERAGKWLSNMLSVVGLPCDLFSNRSGRSTLVTRMAARGVPDEVGMMISGHHTNSGYSRYDRTQELKMNAAVLVSASTNVDYEKALIEVSKQFVEEKVVGNSGQLKPLIDKISSEPNLHLSVISPRCEEASSNEVDEERVVSQTKKGKQEALETVEPVDTIERERMMAEWHKKFDEIDWISGIAKNDPEFSARTFSGGTSSSSISVGNSLSGNRFENCTITFIVKDDKENKDPKKET